MIPVNVITGFLGSGKTTLLRELLQHPSFEDAAVIVNEFGEVGLDHLLLEQVEEGVLLLDSGCICCTIRSDLQDTIHNLQKRAAEGTIPKFSRVFVETTGLADPAPILSTVLADPMIRNHFRTGNVVCTVDALAGLNTIDQHPEAAKQIAVAERILLTKSDLCEDTELIKVEDKLKQLNPFADITRTFGQNFNAVELIGSDVGQDGNRPAEVENWLKKARARLETTPHAAESVAFNSFVLDVHPSIDWSIFAIWLTAMLHKHGDRILRVKGILKVHESETPVVMQCVQHIVHPPMHLAEWPTDTHHSRLVFITHDIAEEDIRRSLEVFLSLEDIITNTGDLVTSAPEGVFRA